MKKNIVCSLADKEFLSKEETLVWLGIGKDTLSEMRVEGLKCIRRKGRIFFSKELIREYLKHYII